MRIEVENSKLKAEVDIISIDACDGVEFKVLSVVETADLEYGERSVEITELVLGKLQSFGYNV